MCETSIQNSDGKKIELRPQRGPNCGLYALSLTLNYLYEIDIPATKGDVEGASFSLRELFKNQKQTIIGEIYNAEKFADFINNLDEFSPFDEREEGKKITCSCEDFSLGRIKEITESGGLCLVPFCVTPYGVSEENAGLPSDSGENAHWCLVHEYSEGGMKACHWGGVYNFDAEKLKSSNAAIKDVPESYFGKANGKSMSYAQCATKTSEQGLRGEPIKDGSIETIPAASLQTTLANKMIVFPRP